MWENRLDINNDKDFDDFEEVENLSVCLRIKWGKNNREWTNHEVL